MTTDLTPLPKKFWEKISCKGKGDNELASKLFTRLLDTVGDGTGDVQAIGDYSETPAAFRIRAAPGERLFIQTFVCTVEDVGTFTVDGYGAASALEVGVSIYVADAAGEILYQLTNDADPLIRNAEWAHLTGHAQFFADNASGAVSLVAVFQLADQFGQAVELLPGWSFVVYLNDDFSGLVQHHFYVQGHYALGTRGEYN